MTHEIVPRRSDSYSMTPFDFFEDFGRSFFDGFPSNLIDPTRINISRQPKDRCKCRRP